MGQYGQFGKWRTFSETITPDGKEDQIQGVASHAIYWWQIVNLDYIEMEKAVFKGDERSEPEPSGCHKLWLHTGSGCGTPFSLWKPLSLHLTNSSQLMSALVVEKRSISWCMDYHYIFSCIDFETCRWWPLRLKIVSFLHAANSDLSVSIVFSSK